MNFDTVPTTNDTKATSTEPIQNVITIAIRRLRQRRALRFGASGLLIGSLFGFAITLAITNNFLKETTLPGGGGFLFLPSLAGLLGGVFVGIVGKYDRVGVARLLERRLDLKERLSTALSRPQDNSPLEAIQHADALKYVPTNEEIVSAIPITPIPRHAYIAVAVTLAVALTYFAPELPVFWSPARRAEQVAVKKEGERLLTIAKAAVNEAKRQNLPEAEKAAHKVEKLGKEMTRGRMPLREALVERAKLSDELRKAQDKIARQKQASSDKQTASDLSNTGRDLSKNLQSSGSTPAQNPVRNSPDERMKALQDALASGDKGAVARVLREIADAAERGEPAPGAERDKNGQQLKALGDALGKNNLPDAGKSAEKAGEAMSKNAMPDAAEALRQAADKVEQSNPRQANPTNPNAEKQSGATSNSPSRSAAGEQTALQKMMAEVQKLAGNPGQQASQNGKGQPQQVAGQQARSQNSPQAGGTPSQSSAKNPSQQSPSGNPPGSSPSSQGTKPGQTSQQTNGASSGKSGQSNTAGSKPGTGAGNKPGQGKAGGKSAKSGSSSNSAGSGSTGNAKMGTAAERLGKGAIEQNVQAKHSGEGPETVITENDKDRSALPVSSLPYYKEFVKQRGGPAQESAQVREAVPSAYRNQVRGYFDSLPTKSGAKGQ